MVEFCKTLQLTPDNSNFQAKLKNDWVSEVWVIEGKISKKITWRENKFTAS